jgi:transposase
MSQKPIAMEQLKQIIQLKKDGIRIREMARRVGISRNSVRKYLALIASEESDSLSNTQLADKAYNNAELQEGTKRLEQLMLHFNSTSSELSKTGVTRQLLWQEYLQQYPDGYGYSRYCFRLTDFLKHRDVSMHLEIPGR